ncbi:hypothetical protein [Streptomyces nigrescens]
MSSPEPHDISAELGALMATLQRELTVYVRHGRFPADAAPEDVRGGLAVQVHTLVAELHRYWQRYASGGTGLATVPQIEASLEPVDAAAAVELLTTLSVDDLLWPGFTRGDRGEAHHAATGVVELLGPAAEWWTTRDAYAWNTVTACTCDGVIAGSDGYRFAVLIQVGED